MVAYTICVLHRLRHQPHQLFSEHKGTKHEGL